LGSNPAKAIDGRRRKEAMGEAKPTMENSGPVCVYCRNGTTPQLLVEAYVQMGNRRGFYAHGACLSRNVGKPVPPDPKANLQLPVQSPEEALAVWNGLVDEFENLLGKMRAIPHALATAEAACEVWNANSYKRTDMTWAVVDPRPNRPNEAHDHCRALRWHLENLKLAIERDPLQSGRRNVISLSAAHLRLPSAVDEVRR
jgi:hypothetical protein